MGGGVGEAGDLASVSGGLWISEVFRAGEGSGEERRLGLQGRSGTAGEGACWMGQI